MKRTLLRLAGLSLCLLPFACAAVRAAESGAAPRFDVLRYDARVEPDIAGK